jgi:hypothetical protein
MTWAVLLQGAPDVSLSRLSSLPRELNPEANATEGVVVWTRYTMRIGVDGSKPGLICAAAGTAIAHSRNAMNWRRPKDSCIARFLSR